MTGRLTPKAGLLLVILASFWGASFLFIRVSAPAVGPSVLMDVRVLLAAAVLILYALAWKKRLPKLTSRWKSFLLLGAINAALPFTLIAFAELRLPASLAAILNATTPLFGAVVAALWLKEPLTVKKSVGLCLGVLGVIVLTGGGHLHLNWLTLLSIGASLLGACCYGIGGVYSRVAFADEAPLTLAIGQELGATLVLLPLALTRIPAHVPSFRVVAAIIALAVLSTSMAYLIYFHLMRQIGSTLTLSVTFLVPVFGLLWASLFLHEKLSLSWLIGLGIILIGMWCVTGISFKRTKQLTAKPLLE